MTRNLHRAPSPGPVETAHARVASALRQKGAACTAVAESLRAVALALEGEDSIASQTQATLLRQLARTEEHEAATCEAEARTADSRAARSRGQGA